MKLGNRAKEERRYFGVDTVLTFGKHEGEMLGDCAHSYIFWIVSNFENCDFSKEILNIADNYEYQKEYGNNTWDPNEDMDGFGSNDVFMF